MITQKQLNQYRLEVNSAATDAKNYIKAILEAYQTTYPSATVAEIREYTLAAIQDAMYVFGTQACSVANIFFEEIAQQEGAAVQTQIYDTHNNAKAEDKVHWLADKLKNGDISGFNSKAGDLTAFYVKRSAFENMVQNCSKNGIRYARVPSGRETCGFCFMLSSRGFVYTSKKAAGEGHSYHTKCDCVIVPGFHEDTGISGDTQVEGYKPSELYERFTKCQNAIDPKGDKGLLLERYNALKKEGATKYTWEQFKQHELIKEIESRDWGWLWNNEPCKLVKDPEWNDNERTVANLLADNGFNVEYIKRSVEFRKRKADFTLNGVKWEMKNPTGNGRMCVMNQFKKVVFGSSNIINPQSDKLVISNVGNNMSFEVLNEKIKKVFTEKRFIEIKEVITLDKTGKMCRWKR